MSKSIYSYIRKEYEDYKHYSDSTIKKLLPNWCSILKSVQNDCKKEYEEKLRWIPVEEKLPEFNDSEYPNGNFEEYEVKFCTGGMSPKYFIRISHLINKTKFSGEFDWTHATHWRRIL